MILRYNDPVSRSTPRLVTLISLPVSGASLKLFYISTRVLDTDDCS